MKQLYLCIAVCVLIFGMIASAQVPNKISYQGILTLSSGAPATDGNYNLKFDIYNALTFGTIRYTQTSMGVSVTKGSYQVILGPLPHIFSEPLYVELTILAGSPGVSTDITFSPRAELTAVPYALNALPLSGGNMTGAITNTGNPEITMGKANFGADNTNPEENTFVAGFHNNATGRYSSVTGGEYNTSSGPESNVGGGNSNVASGPGSTIGGGQSNSASAGKAVVGGGESNAANAEYSAIGGGVYNTVNGEKSVVAGGQQNQASGTNVSVGGGFYNHAIGDFSAIPGGMWNLAEGRYSFASGRSAKVHHDGTFAWADSTDLNFESTAPNQFLIRAQGGVGIGTNAPTQQLHVHGVIHSDSGGFKFPDGTVQTTAIAGGSGYYLPRAGGVMTGAITSTGNPEITMGKANFGAYNTNPEENTFVAGFYNNAYGRYSSVTGGDHNTASGGMSFIGGGNANSANGLLNTIAGGEGNTTSGEFSTISGGAFNIAAELSSIGGGYNNAGNATKAAISGGENNTANGAFSAIGGGYNNVTSADYSTVPGGKWNTAAGRYSFAAGRSAKALHDGTLVWADSADLNFESTAPNQFIIRASGGVGIGTNAPTQPLQVAGTIYASSGGFKFPDGTVQSSAGAVGSFLPLGGGVMTGAITNTGNPEITMGKGSFGAENTNTGENSFVAGWGNSATGIYSSVMGGDHNTASGPLSIVGGGNANIAEGNGSTLGGGAQNVAGGEMSVVSGGFSNRASALDAVVPGGFWNYADGRYSFAAGRQARANHDGTFVWADSTEAHFASTAPNQFLIRAGGGVGINQTAPTASLDVTGTTGYNQLRMRTSFTPTGTSDSRGNIGDFAWDANYVYVKTADGWKRSSLGTW